VADRPYDKERLKHLIHYVIWKAGARPGFGATKLYKSAWFSEAKQFLLTGKSITGAPYIREKHGPIPRDGIILRNELAASGLIQQWKGTGGEWVFKALARPTAGVFNSAELQTIDFWITEIDKNHTASSISDLSHDYAWEIAAMKEPLPFTSFMASRGREPTDQETERLRDRAKELEEMSQTQVAWLHRYSNHLKRARNVFDTLDADEAIELARFDLKDALALLEEADDAIGISGVKDINALTYDKGLVGQG
jgi:hypothetical protein